MGLKLVNSINQSLNFPTQYNPKFTSNKNILSKVVTTKFITKPFPLYNLLSDYYFFFKNQLFKQYTYTKKKKPF